jgi:hypothetical protein
MQVLRASTTEERGGCGRIKSAKRREKNGKTECRRCQQNTRKRGRTVRLFSDEQPLEGGNVTGYLTTITSTTAYIESPGLQKTHKAFPQRHCYGNA